MHIYLKAAAAQVNWIAVGGKEHFEGLGGLTCVQCYCSCFKAAVVYASMLALKHSDLASEQLTSILLFELK